MNIYICPECGKKFFECELISFKCSENYVGSEIQNWCPNCIKKYKFNKLLKHLEKRDALIKEFNEKYPIHYYENGDMEITIEDIDIKSYCKKI